MEIAPMRIFRLLSIGLAAATLATAAHAEFTGPAPLAWRWSYATSVSPTGAPVIQGDNVYITVGNRLFALDRKSGNQRWRFPIADPIPGFFRNGLLLADDVIVAAGDNRLVYGVDAATGASKWQYPAPANVLGQPVLVGKFVVFAMTDDSLMAINASDGQPAWQQPYKIFAGIQGGIAAHGSNVLYMTGSNEMFALNVNSQKLSWKQRFTVVDNDSVPIVFGDNIYVNTGTWVACLTAATGSARWQQNVGEPLAYSPAVSPDGVMTVSRDGRAFLFDAKSGRPVIRTAIELGSIPATRPSAVDKLFAVPTTNGALNLLNTQGQVVWSFLIRPLTKTASSTTAGGGNAGGGGRGGAGAGGGLAAGGGAGGGQQNEAQVWAIPAAGPAIVNGDTLFVQAFDGSLLAFDRNTGVDLTGPSIRQVWPNQGEQVSGQPPLEFIFRIEDEASGINNQKMKILIDGNDAEYTFGRDGFAIVRISTLGKNKPLTDGRHVVTVIATDWMGNESRLEFPVSVDNTLRPLARPSGTGPQPGGGGGRGGAGDGR
jgi:outer membrane protein assembly factor BamB